MFLKYFMADLFAVVEDGTPTITGPERVHITTLPGKVCKRRLYYRLYLTSKGSKISYGHVCLGKPLMLHCEAHTNQDDVTLIYWLVNAMFPEDTTSRERIVELEE